MALAELKKYIHTYLNRYIKKYFTDLMFIHGFKENILSTLK